MCYCNERYMAVMGRCTDFLLAQPWHDEWKMGLPGNTKMCIPLFLSIFLFGWTNSDAFKVGNLNGLICEYGPNMQTPFSVLLKVTSFRLKYPSN